MSIELEDALFALGKANEDVEEDREVTPAQAPVDQIDYSTLTEVEKQQIVEQMPVEDKFILLRTLAKHAPDDPVVTDTGLADAILDTIPPDDQLTAVKDLPNEEKMVLLRAVSNQSHRSRLLDSVPLNDKLDIIRISTEVDSLDPHEILGGQEFGEFVLDTLSSEDKLSMFNDLPPEEKLSIVSAMPAEDKLVLLRDFNSPLDVAESVPDVGSIILDSMSKQEKLDMIDTLTDQERALIFDSVSATDMTTILGGGSVEHKVGLIRALSKVSFRD